MLIDAYRLLLTIIQFIQFIAKTFLALT